MKHAVWVMNYPVVRSMAEIVDFAVAAEEALGVGKDFDQFGDDTTPRERARRYDEALPVISLLWSGESVTFDGEFFRLDDVTLPVVPKQQPRVPIVVAGWWPNRKPFERAARWDGTMPYWPALLGGRVGPEGQTSDGTVEDELRKLTDFHRSVADDPGEVILPRPERDDPHYDALAEDVGATWLLASYGMDLDEVRAGPPR